MNTPQEKVRQGVKILIAEDSPTQAERLKYHLTAHGYAVTIARDGNEALTQALQSRPSLVITDVLMPGMDGYSLCKEIKSQSALKGVPVILLTSLSTPNDVLRGLECGADNFIRKPYDDAYLLSRVAYILTNLELRKTERLQLGVQLYFGGQEYFITSERQQILDLLISTYEGAVQINADLAAKQKELETANKELEAFSYSVSHDLRSPLRQINGFSTLLLEKHGAQLEPEALSYLKTICNAAQNMGHLIDDLLNLARVGRQQLEVRPTDLNVLVGSVRKDLEGEWQGRSIEWQIGRLPPVECDPGLMKPVFANLLSNAIKYTRPRSLAVIQVDHTTVAGELVIFVRDNGVGFDPKYADKVFAVFSRLHRSEEFEGTGIGLATVQRIVHKHGGRIWADAQVDRGATFFFTLGARENASHS